MRLQDIGCNAVSDPVSRLVEGTAGQMSVARGRLDVAVAEQLADGRQGLAVVRRAILTPSINPLQ